MDVAAVLQALLRLPTLRARLDELAGRPLVALDVQRLVALAFLHDIGKACAGFYARGLAPAQAPWPTWTHAVGNYAPLSGLRQLGQVARALFPDAFDPQAERMARFGSGLVHAFAGLVSLADWIVSNTHPSFFPYDLAPHDQRWHRAEARAVDVLRRMRFDVSQARAALSASAPAFESVFGFEPHETRPP